MVILGQEILPSPKVSVCTPYYGDEKSGRFLALVQLPKIDLFTCKQHTTKKAALVRFAQVFEEEIDQEMIQNIYKYYTKRLHDCRRRTEVCTKNCFHGNLFVILRQKTSGGHLAADASPFPGPGGLAPKI